MKITSCITIAFFSIGFNSVQAQTSADAHAMLSAASKQFRALPKNFSIPVPPHIELKCGKLNEQQSIQINDYAADKFPEPEESILKKIMKAWEILSKLKDEKGADAAMDSTSKVLKRLQKKALYGVNAYGGDKFYCLPISAAAIKVEKETNLITSNSSNEILDLVITKRAEVVQELLNDLKTKHDYSLLNTILYYDKEAHIGREFSDETFQKLSDALKFELSVEMQVQYYIQEDNGGKSLEVSYDTKGKIPVSFDYNLLRLTGKAVLSASGSERNFIFDPGKPDKYCTDALTSTRFPFTVSSLQLDACDKYEVTLEGNSDFGPFPEEWTDCAKTRNMPGRHPNTNNQSTEMGDVVQEALAQAGITSTVPMHFEDFKFIMPINNNSKEAGRVDFFKETNGWVVKLTLIVTHKPK